MILQVARAEEYRYRLEREGAMGPGIGRHWRSDIAIADTRRAFALWIERWDGVDRAQDLSDLNHLLHAACSGGLDALAIHLFKLVGTRATRVPWSYFGDPAEVFRQWYSRLM